MKKILLIYIAIILFATALPVFSVGLETFGIGSKAMGLGGAFIGIADDWKCTYWNPGGLTQLKGRNIGTYLYVPFYAQGDSNSVKNFDLANYSLDQGDIFMRIYPTEPANFNVTGTKGQAYNFGVGMSFELTPKSVFGLSIYAPYGFSSKWSDTVVDSTTQANIAANYDSGLAVIVTNFSYAHQIKESLSIGLGVNAVYSKINTIAQKTYTCAAVPTMDYTFNYNTSGGGFGCEGIIGIMYKPNPKFSLGIVYRTGTIVGISGDASASHTLLGPNENTTFTQRLPLPSTYGVGLAIKPTERAAISFDIKRADWKGMAQIVNYATQGAILTNISNTAGWRNTTSYRFGLNYDLNESLTLRSGFMYEPYAVPDRGIGITGINDTSFKYITFGIGYKKGRSNVDLSIERVFGSRTAAGGDKYSIVMTDYNFGYSYKW